MNFVYDPAQAARSPYYVQYVSPVMGVRDELVNMGGDAAALADSPILFPDRRGQLPAPLVRRAPRRDRRERHRPLPRDHRGLTGGRRRHRRQPQPPVRTPHPLRDRAARAAVPLRLLHRPADHAVQDLAVDQARPPPAPVRVHVGVEQLRHRLRRLRRPNSCARSLTPASAPCCASSSPTRSRTSSPSRPASSGTSCSGW